MTRMIFVNLPVRHLAASQAFYEGLGGTLNPMFSDAEAKCLLFSEAIGVMLLTHERYGQFTSRPIGDAKQQSQALLALSVETRDGVDAVLDAAVAAGAGPTPTRPGISASCMAARSRIRTEELPFS